MSIPLLPTSTTFSRNPYPQRNAVSLNNNADSLFGTQPGSNTNRQSLAGTTAMVVKPDTVHFGRGKTNGMEAHPAYDAGYDSHVAYDDGVGRAGYHNAQVDFQKQVMGKTAASLNKVVKGVGAGLGGFLVTAGFTALLALPAAGFVAVVGCVPLMHWLWPIAAGIATMPLILGGIVGGIKGLMTMLRK